MFSVFNFPDMPQEIRRPPRSNFSRGGIKQLPWKEAEDAKLRQLVQEHGLKQWSTVAKLLNQVNWNVTSTGMFNCFHGLWIDVQGKGVS